MIDQSGGLLGWTGYTWNKVLFPDPDAFLKKLHEDGLKTTLNLHPASGIQPWEQAYPAMARAMGIDPATKKYVPFDPTDKKWATNYLDLVLHPLEKQGIDFWWLDWQQQSTTDLPGVNPTWWLNYVHFTDQQREGKRPLLFHRWGGLGNHRYQIGFSGDTISVWDSLAFQPWFTATAANVGYAFWSHDIGGHMPGAVDPELYTRWIQFGTFSPILRTHTTKNPDSERRIWAYPEPYSSVMRIGLPAARRDAAIPLHRGAAHLRHRRRVLPAALLRLARRGRGLHQQERIHVRRPDDREPRDCSRGQDLRPCDGAGLAAQSDSKGRLDRVADRKALCGANDRAAQFYHRPDSRVCSCGHDRPHAAGHAAHRRKASRPADRERVAARSGPSSSYSVYEDSGVSVEYQRGVFARTPIRASENGDTLRIEIGPVAGSYPGMLKTRGYEVRLPDDWPPATVTVNGKALKFAKPGEPGGWTFEGNTLTTVIPVPTGSVSTKAVIEIRRANGRLAQRAQLDGFAGRHDAPARSRRCAAADRASRRTLQCSC